MVQILVELAKKHKLDPVIGRDEEIRRASKNTYLEELRIIQYLIGEPGVGKTAIVEGLAERIVRGDVPEGLKDKIIFLIRYGFINCRCKI